MGGEVVVAGGGCREQYEVPQGCGQGLLHLVGKGDRHHAGLVGRSGGHGEGVGDGGSHR